MGIFDKLFSKEDKEVKEDRTVATTTIEAPACTHVALTPRWDSVDDMGKEELATEFVCEACHVSFSPEEARELQESIADRLVGQAESLN